MRRRRKARFYGMKFFGVLGARRRVKNILMGISWFDVKVLEDPKVLLSVTLTSRK